MRKTTSIKRIFIFDISKNIYSGVVHELLFLTRLLETRYVLYTWFYVCSYA